VKILQVHAENVCFLRQEVLRPLTNKEVAGLMNVSPYILSKWMKAGIYHDDKKLANYHALEAYIETHGAKSVMESGMIAMPGMEDGMDRRCNVLVETNGRYSRCGYTRMVGSELCAMHKEKVEIYGAVYLTLDGNLAARKLSHFGKGPSAKRCIAYCHGGQRCMFAGDLKGGLCRVHLKELEMFGKISVCRENLTETRYA